LEVNSINLLLGPNGSGKSTVFEVLHNLVEFAGGRKKVDDLFRSANCTRWQESAEQTFEVSVEGREGLFKYELVIEHPQERARARVQRERLSLNNKPLYEFIKGEVHLYRDNHSAGPLYSFDWSQSALTTILPRVDNTRLTWFKERLQNIFVLQPLPPEFEEESAAPANRPSFHLENFVSWYRRLSEDQGVIVQLTTELHGVLPGFDYFKFEEFGEERRQLRVYMKTDGIEKSIPYRFSELSDGQRALIALYTLLFVAGRAERGQLFTLCLDEPENYLALPEIQPWLTTLYDRCSEGRLQALVISHHPEMIDYLLASPVGYWFDRQGNGPTRVSPIAQDTEVGLPISELIARGWLRD
jgi:predicted ATPase